VIGESKVSVLKSESNDARSTLKLVPVGRQPSFSRLSKSELIGKVGIAVPKYKTMNPSYGPPYPGRAIIAS
jgi:hypothetical protein